MGVFETLPRKIKYHKPVSPEQCARIIAQHTTLVSFPLRVSEMGYGRKRENASGR